MTDKDNIKIGARILSKEALEILLPEYNNIFQQIKGIRKTAYEYRHSNKGNRNKEFDAQFNNVFSILGDRGTGKTSAVLTIKNIITKENKQDIVLDLIVPENMGDNSDVLGWLFAQFQKKVEELTKELGDSENKRRIKDVANAGFYNDYYKDCILKRENSLTQKFDDLIKHYRYIDKDYKEVLLKEYDTFNSYVKATKNILAPEDTLTTKFEKFIDELVRVKAALYKLNASDNEVEPLIYVFFDDVDLSNHRCVEILNVILRYLSKANIVTFVTGDYKIFSEMTTINLLDKDKLLKGDLVFKNFYELGVNEELTDDIYSALDMRKRLTKDILKKIMPPSLRYYMAKFDNEKKASFKYSVDGNNDYKELKDLIFEKLINPMQKYSNNNININNIKQSFLYYNNTFIDTYFEIFDDTARGLMNIYYFLYNIDIETILENRQEALKILKSFLNVVVESSNVLTAYKEEINRIFKINNAIDDKIDFEYFASEFKGKEEVRYRIFVIIYFIHSLIPIYIQGYDEEVMIEILNKNSGEISGQLPLKLYPKYFRTSFNFALNRAIKKAPRITVTDYNSQVQFIEIYLQNLESIIYNKYNDYHYSIFYEISKFDSEWIEKIVKAIKFGTENRSEIIKFNIKILEENYKYLFSNEEIRLGFNKSLNDKFKDIKDFQESLDYYNKLLSIEGELRIYNNLYRHYDNHKYELSEKSINEIRKVIKSSTIPSSSKIFKVVERIIQNKYASSEDYNVLMGYVNQRLPKNNEQEMNMSIAMKKKLKCISAIIEELDYNEVETEYYNDYEDISSIVKYLVDYISYKVPYDKFNNFNILKTTTNMFKDKFDEILANDNTGRAFKKLVRQARNEY